MQRVREQEGKIADVIGEQGESGTMKILPSLEQRVGAVPNGVSTCCRLRSVDDTGVTKREV